MRRKKAEIKAILFDSGRVLNKPSTGNWFISPGFFKYVDKNKYSAISNKRINKAFNEAGRYINSKKLITTKEQEYMCFQKYYKIFSDNLSELELSVEEVNGLAEDLVYNYKKYIFFDDALKVIPELKAKYKLAVVSDAWPSLKDVYINNKLINYFDSFVISSVLGVTKPNEKMYLTALNELRLLPEETIFIDDNINNCNGAMKLGIKAILLCRNKLLYIIYKLFSIGKNYEVINNLEQIKYSRFL